jgi:glutamate-ammonia-ligase adenylyltransferase
MREKVRAARPGARRPVRREAQRRRHDGRGVRRAVPGAGARPQPPALLDNKGNIALLQRAEAAGLLPPAWARPGPMPTANCAAPSTARLDEQPTQFEPERYAVQRDAVLAVWHAVFG